MMITDSKQRQTAPRDGVDLEQIKTEVHQTLFSKLDLEKLASVETLRARQAVATMVQEILTSRNVPLLATFLSMPVKKTGSSPTF
jgi:hypothetical protein